MKKTSSALRALALLILFGMVLCGQASLAQTPDQTPANPAPPPAKELQSFSAITQPALDSIQQALADVRLLKWKTSSNMRDETTANINSILRDIATTLPPLLVTADAAPDSGVHALPAYRNIEALYDVLLRVTEAGRFAAPTQQYAALQQALLTLEGARRTFADRLQSIAVASDQQLHTLQTALHTAQHTPPPAPPPPPCPTPHPTTRKHHTHPKPVEKKPTPPSTQSSATTPSP